MSDMTFMRHPDTGGETWVRNKQNVITAHEARGWEKAEPPDPRLKPKQAPRAPGQEWVEMWHSSGGSQRVPNKPAALEEARRRGWDDKPPAKSGEAPKALKSNKKESIDG